MAAPTVMLKIAAVSPRRPMTRRSVGVFKEMMALAPGYCGPQSSAIEGLPLSGARCPKAWAGAE